MMTNKRQNILYVVYAYAFFWAMLLLIGVTMLLFGDGLMGGLPYSILVALGSWTPTVALLVLFKKLYPGSTIRNFYANAFREKISWKLLLTTGALQLLVYIASVSMVSLTKGVALSGLLNLSAQTLVMGFIMTLIQGATGEESGWRGFLQPSVEKSYGVIKSCLIVGVIWGFWHAPLWFLTSGYSGMQLAQYIIAFLISVVSVATIIGICYNRCKNLFVPMFIHFLFNFFNLTFRGDLIDMLTCFALLYAIMAGGYILWFRRCSRRVLSCGGCTKGN